MAIYFNSVFPSAPALSDPNRPFYRSKIFWIALACNVLLAACINYIRYDLRSYALLAQFLNPKYSDAIVRFEKHDVDSQEVTFNTRDGAIRARLYVPRGVWNPPGIVLAHGIHHLGIDEPRLMNFARAAASDGFTVLTPEIAALADYHVDNASIDTIGYSANWLQRRLANGPVTVVGVSFAGGLSLLAACDLEYAPHIRALVLMGAYDNLARVARFLATSHAEFPDGRLEPYPAHDYGAAVFVYSHLDQFFPAADLPVAREALRDWLWEQPAAAQALFPRLGPESRDTMQMLLARQIDKIRPRLLAAIQADDAQLSELSLQGKLGALRAPVFLLHGATDDIIPSTETLWLEKDIPSRYLRAALITPAFSHVDPDRHASRADELRLVAFLGSVLRAANE